MRNHPENVTLQNEPKTNPNSVLSELELSMKMKFLPTFQRLTPSPPSPMEERDGERRRFYSQLSTQNPLNYPQSDPIQVNPSQSGYYELFLASSHLCVSALKPCPQHNGHAPPVPLD
jgi:hypothetical protein